MQTTHPDSGDAAWRSEEDYYLGRLAVTLGILDEEAVKAALSAQGQYFAAGQPITLGQILLREGQVPPDALMRLKHEMLRCYHPCPGCGVGRYYAPGPQHREEPCTGCGGGIPVPAAGTSVSGSFVRKRQDAMHGSQRWSRQHPMLESGVEQGPKLFANYILEGEIARGGMGAIYRVRQAETGEPYALKVLLAAEKATERQVHRFQRETKAQQELGDHPHIVKIHDAGQWEGILYYAMDLVDGTDLGAAFTALSQDERLTILAKTARAVHHAHEHGYIHRDLKPANILLSRDNQPLVTDFGLAKNLGGDTRLTQEGAIMGTPNYMAPEQATGQVEQMGPRTDVFSLGVLLYELVTGELPFVADTAVELYRQILELTPSAFAEHGVMTPDLEQICFRAIQKDPELRYPTALAFAEDLERVVRGEKPLTSQVSSAARMARTVEQHKRSIGVLLAMVTLGVLVILGVAIGAKLTVQHVKQTRELTQREDAAKAAIHGLDQALAEVATLPQREGVRTLEEALGAARAVTDAQAAQVAEDPDAPQPPSFEKLRAKLRTGLLARVRLALAGGSGGAALAALEHLAVAQAGGSKQEQAAALALRVRCLWRLGRDREAKQALAKLRPLARRTPATLAFLEGILARRGKEPKEALRRFDRAARDTSLALDAHLERARVFLELGQEADANKALQRALRSVKATAPVRQRWAEILIQNGRDAEATGVYLEALEAEPGDLGLARAVTALLLRRGRPHEAVQVLNRARKRRPGEAELDALWLRARAHLGHDTTPQLEALGEGPEARLLRGDVAAAGGAKEPYASLSGDDRRVLAARARWLVHRGQRDAAKALIAKRGLGDLLLEVPHDRLAPPGLARAVRDLGWAWLGLGARASAAKAARAALRGLPADVDACLLLARADPKPGHARQLEQAFVAECESLQGSLGRGLLLARAVRLRKLPPIVSKQARALLRARLLGQWDLTPVRQELARLRGEQPAAPDDAIPWAAVLPPLPKLKPRDVSAKQRKRAHTLALEADGLPAEKKQEAVALAREVLTIDPYSFLARETLWDRLADLKGRKPPLLLGWLHILRVRPGYALGMLLRYQRDWREASIAFFTTPTKAHTEMLLGDGATDPIKLASAALVQYLGLLYPEDTKPVWMPGKPGQVIARIDRVLRLDPQLCGLLYVRAHLLARLGQHAAARRDLNTVRALRGENLDLYNKPMPYWDELYRAWIVAPFDEDEALKALARVKQTVEGGKHKILLHEWLNKAPGFEEVKKTGGWKRFLQRFRKLNARE